MIYIVMGGQPDLTMPGYSSHENTELCPYKVCYASLIQKLHSNSQFQSRPLKKVKVTEPEYYIFLQVCTNSSFRNIHLLHTLLVVVVHADSV